MDRQYQLFSQLLMKTKNKNNNNNYNNENNDNHRFVNLPHIILLRIIKEIENDIDRVCFSLVCKRWFDQRNCYLSFNCKDLILDRSHMIKNIKYFTLKSYINLFQSRLDQILIPSESIVDYPRNQLPLKHDRLPLNIKEIISYYPIRQHILPLALERLEIQLTNEIYQKIDIDVSLLPRSLKALHLFGIQPFQPIDINKLPPSLEEFKCQTVNGNDMIHTTQLPSTLKILELSHCVQFLKHLQSLHTLHLHITNSSDTWEIGDIPESVTHLTIESNTIKFIVKEMLPSKLKYLKLIHYFEFKKNIFSEFRHLETLDLSMLSRKDLAFDKLPDQLKEETGFRATDVRVLGFGWIHWRGQKTENSFT
ncbi:hypothetical protein PPL_10862 [Heterostelium album PN500]|uniref:F-box domain-containing protein n=1 Tax=Heterostelium pallidum (strain ATCC 26659 / Pp 5 / PN500) TaxID=670386 RepID=D3BS70_HETP5|nr:hypothetical protein PPL_10862 [Heterostelium album PN500]EFA75807.1 hypothetical protein PPL_10862 [Heterostelium album PN500]|eukprot:XP_020427941.1 hypothetical protein PPL_10862 [Heterostelium album PN500]